MNTQDSADALLAQMYAMARAQFGNAVKSYWFYKGSGCPGCGGRVTPTKIKGREAVSLNTFIDRKSGVLIGYMLCDRCARHVFRAAQRNPGVQTALHTTIEANLIKAYLGRIDELPA